MNLITKRVPRDPTGQQLEIGIETLRGFFSGDDIELRRIASSVYQGMVSRAPIDPLESAIERHWQETKESAA